MAGKRSGKHKAAPTPHKKPGKEAPVPSKLPLWITMGLLFFAVWLAYAPALDNSFVSWDDQDYVTERPEVLNPTSANLAALWRKPVSLNYHPVTMMTLAWNSHNATHDRRTGLPEARPFITTNIFLHALNTLLVLLFIHRLTRGNLAVAAFTALVFALHPMHVESVAWVSERKDVLYAFFLLAGLLTYLKWVRVKRPAWYAATVLLFLLACLSKAMAVVFPLMLLLVDLWEGRSWKDRWLWLEKVPLLAIALFFGLLAMDIQSGNDMHGMLDMDRELGRTVAVAESANIPLMDRLLAGGYGFTMYVVKFLLPVGLSTFHPYPDGGAKGALFVGCALFMLVALALSVWSLRRGKLVFFSMGFFTICLLLVLQFIPVGRAIMADRYTYLPYIGLAFLLASGIDLLLRKTAKRDRGWILVTAATGLILIPMTRGQADVWQNTSTLFKPVIALYPKSPDPYATLGSWYGTRSVREGRPQLLDSAGMVLSQGVRAGAASGPLFEAMGTYYGSQGRTDSALVHFSRAVAMGPVTGQLLHNRATARLGTDPAGASADLSRAIAIGHSAVGESYVLRSKANYRLRLFNEAFQDADTAITRYRIERGESYMMRALSLFELGRREEARKDALITLKLDPNNVQAARLMELLGA